MSKFEHTLPLMNILTNIYKLGGVILSPSNSSCDDINLDTHTCGRSFARAVLKVAFVVSICFLSAACQQAYLIPDEEAEEDTRGMDGEAPADSTVVKPELDIEGWGEPIDAEFTLGGEPEE